MIMHLAIQYRKVCLSLCIMHTYVYMYNVSIYMYTHIYSYIHIYVHMHIKCPCWVLLKYFWLPLYLWKTFSQDISQWTYNYYLTFHQIFELFKNPNFYDYNFYQTRNKGVMQYNFWYTFIDVDYKLCHLINQKSHFMLYLLTIFLNCNTPISSQYILYKLYFIFLWQLYIWW